RDVTEQKMPQDWHRSACSLPADDAPHSYRAANYDELVDSPIVAGAIHVHPFQVGDVPLQLVNVGAAEYWDGDAAARDLKKIVQQQSEIFGSLPYDRYLFLNVINESRGGLEHDNNCLMMTSRYSFRDKKKYEDWLSLASHEHFHAWNIRRLRPTELKRYDYENEVYTDNLWVAEGITSYFEDLVLARAGLISGEKFLQRISKSIQRVEYANGHHVQSLRDASYDTWIKFYRPDENSANTRVSYYAKGAIVAMLLDAKIRQDSNGQRSLNDLMRQLFETYTDRGYTQQDVRRLAGELAGTDLSQWFASAVDTTDDLRYQPMLQQWGLQFVNESTAAKTSAPVNEGQSGSADGKRDEPEKNNAKKKNDSKPTPKKPWVGMEISDGKIKSLIENGPAYDAGLLAGDEVLAVDSVRLGSSLDQHLGMFQVGDRMVVTIARRGRVMDRQVVIAENTNRNWTLIVDQQADASQRDRRAAWLK
ncbi:MAG: PDZ domain-containing protein, partial [Planctomycetota bacterium]